jgi:hypothetical protein
MMHMVLFGHHQDGEDPVVPTDNVQTYQHYAMTNTRLDGESFAVRFLAYLSALSSGSESEKALLQFAYHQPSSSSSSELSVIPIPAGFSNSHRSPNGPTPKLSDIQPGSWVVLVGLSKQISDPTEPAADTPPQPDGPPPLDYPREYHADDDVVIQYSFVRIPQAAAETIEPDPSLPASRAEVVGGLTDFLSHTAPETDLPAWETRIGEIRAWRGSVGTGQRSIAIGTMSESRARELLDCLV